MALQIRRGTNAERLTITPLEGELIYTTDTKLIYVGDGTTAGGTKADTGISSLLEDSTPQLGGSLDLNSQNIDGTGNIDITGTISATQVDSDITGSVFADNSTLLVDAVAGKIVGPVEANVTGNLTGNVTGDVTGNVTGDVTGNLTGNVTGNVTGTVTGDVSGSVFADNSTLLIDAVAGKIVGPVEADVTGNLTGDAEGNHSGTFTGEVIGSVFADDSTLVIDGIDGSVTTTSATITDLNTNEISDRNDSGLLTINMNNDGGNSQPRVIIESNGASGSGLWITTNDTSRTLAGTDNIGRVLFRSIDAGGTETPAVMIARKDELIIAVGSKNTAETFHMATSTGNYGMGIDPDASAKVNVGGAMLLGNLTTTERNALTAANGMIIYNTTDNKFQGYENGAWVNLV